jgi:hypothetical protein
MQKRGMNNDMDIEEALRRTSLIVPMMRMDVGTAILCPAIRAN